MVCCELTCELFRTLARFTTAKTSINSMGSHRKNNFANAFMITAKIMQMISILSCFAFAYQLYLHGKFTNLILVIFFYWWFKNIGSVIYCFQMQEIDRYNEVVEKVNALPRQMRRKLIRNINN